MATPVPITSGAKLIKALRESGTGDNKLTVARQVLTDAGGRDVPAKAVLDALEADPGVSEVTLEKARQLAATGKWTLPAPPTAIEDLILGPAAAPPTESESESDKKKK